MIKNGWIDYLGDNKLTLVNKHFLNLRTSYLGPLFKMSHVAMNYFVGHTTTYGQRPKEHI